MSAQNAAHAARFVPGWDLSVWGSDRHMRRSCVAMAVCRVRRLMS